MTRNVLTGMLNSTIPVCSQTFHVATSTFLSDSHNTWHTRSMCKYSLTIFQNIDFKIVGNIFILAYSSGAV